jgi:hypothetical protein
VVGEALAQALWDAAQRTVGGQHGPSIELQVRYASEDIATLRSRIAKLDKTSVARSIGDRPTPDDHRRRWEHDGGR